MLLDAEELCYQVFPIIQQHVSKYRSKYSKKTYTQPQYVMLNILRLWWDCKYREVYKRVRNRSGIQNILGLESTPYYTNINGAFKKHNTLLYRQLNQRILKLLPHGYNGRRGRDGIPTWTGGFPLLYETDGNALTGPEDDVISGL